jgi:hypothetical protein
MFAKTTNKFIFVLQINQLWEEHLNLEKPGK